MPPITKYYLLKRCYVFVGVQRLRLVCVILPKNPSCIGGWVIINQAVQPRQGTEICNFGVPESFEVIFRKYSLQVGGHKVTLKFKNYPEIGPFTLVLQSMCRGVSNITSEIKVTLQENQIHLEKSADVPGGENWVQVPFRTESV